MTPLSIAINDHLAYLKVRDYSPRTVEARRYCLIAFEEWTFSLGIEEAPQITRRILLAYQRRLYHQRKKNDMPLSARTQSRHLSALKMFFKWLTKQDIIDANPAADLELPREVRSLPRDVLSAEEVEKVMAIVDETTPLGLRDRAILETFYATGLRRAEIANLDLSDIDFFRLRIFVRQGKGKKDRVVPMAKRAADWIIRYLEVRQSSHAALFVSAQGERLTLWSYSSMARSYLLRSGVVKRGSCHLFRHTMATLMLENGADVRFVQEMLGHASLETTQIYTRVSIRKLQEIYNVTHPSAK